jgi:prepilin-type N-terminal cleavage/methylation domain-containing protein
MIRSKGFTIVELLIVIVVIAILAAISIVVYSGIQARARESADQAVVSRYIKAFKLMKADLGNLPVGHGSDSSCLGPAPQPEMCGLGGQNATASSSATTNMKALLAQYGIASQSAVGVAYTNGYLVYTSQFYGEPALLWQVPSNQDCVATPARFAVGSTWTDGLKYSSRGSNTVCHMSLNNI